MASDDTKRTDPFAIAPVPDSPDDHLPDVVRTPEGDNETAPDAPLRPSGSNDDLGVQVPRGNEPDVYKGEV